MAVTVDDLAQHLGFAVTPADPETLERALGAARAIIAPHLDPTVVATPDQTHTLDLATLICAGSLWRAKDAHGGSYVFAEGTDHVGVLPRDAFATVRPMLAEADLIPAVTV